MGLEAHKKGSAQKKERDFQKELNNSLLRFQAAFELIQVTEDKLMKKYYFDTMDKELSLLDNLVNSVNRRKIRKQEKLLSKDAKAYILDQNQENFEKLRQDIATLKEANQIPKNIIR